MEKKLAKILEDLQTEGELILGSIHICYWEHMPGDEEYRFYHADGHCATFLKTLGEDEDGNETWEYEYDELPFDDFTEFPIKKLIGQLSAHVAV